MGERPFEPDLGAKAREDRLDSWKEIAAYLRRDVTTVQRWEKREGMPVHRHLHDRLGTVRASKAELDSWVRSRSLAADAPPAGVVSPAGPRRAWPIVVAAAAAAAAIGGALWWARSERFWRSPIAEARFQTVTDFDASTQSAALSRDGQFVAFVSDRDGSMDVWVTQVGSGQFHNLTRGRVREIVNPSVRTLGFSPDGAAVTFWSRRPDGSEGGSIGIWSVPTLGGPPRVYLDGAAELDWSRDGRRVAYHTADPGDPLFVAEGLRGRGTQIFASPAGLHGHFPLWAPDDAFLYFVQGTLPDGLDVWRIRPSGGAAERVTSHDTRVSHPVLTSRRTLLYLASDRDGSGPYLYAMDVSRRVAHRLTAGPERYTSLSASADGRRLVATVARSKRTVWRLGIGDAPAAGAARPTLAVRTGFAPRLGADGLVYAASTGAAEGIWKLAGDSGVELWNGRGAKLLGGPAVSPDGRAVAFSARQDGRSILYAMQSDGTGLRILADSLDLQGAPAWAPDGKSLAVAAAERGSPRVFRVPAAGGAPSILVPEYALDPAWAPDGGFLVFSGPDVGTTFSAKAVGPDGAPHVLPALTLTRGGRRLAFASGGRALVYLRGDLQHKDLWLVDLATGAERPLTNLPPDFDVRDFDVSPDGREVVLERAEERSDVVLLDLPR